MGAKKQGIYHLGVDLGGTAVKAGLFTGDFGWVDRRSAPVDALAGPDRIVRMLAEICDELLFHNRIGKEEVRGVGLSSPGVVDAETGTVLYSNNFNWEHVPLAALLEEKCGLPVRVENDAACAVLGEALKGNAAGCRDVVMLTLGTGVGSGILCRGRPVTGTGCGGVAGHMIIRQGGRKCTCGKRGCLEAYASATALLKAYRRRAGIPLGGAVPDGEAFFRLVQQQDPAAVRVYREFIEALSTGIANLIDIFRPEKVLLGGGLSNAGPVLFDAVNRRVPELCYAAGRIRPCRVEAALLKNDAGMVGAASLLGGECP